MSKISRYLVIFLLFLLAGSMLTACSAGNGATKDATPGASASSPASGAQTPLAPPSTSSGTVTGPTGVSQPGGMPDIADMKTLSSYRYSIKTSMVEGEGAGADSLSCMKYEWVRDQKAEHAWMEDSNGKVTEVYITIGDKHWIWMGMGGMGWIEQPAGAGSSAKLPQDFASQLKQAQQDAKNSKVRFDKKGAEMVNNVRCTRYEIEYNMSVDIPNLAGGGSSKSTVLVTGDIWISDQSGLPAVLIRSKGRNEMTTAGKKMVMDIEQNLTDIGGAITINPPEGAKPIPGDFTPPTFTTTMPAIPPTKPVTPTITSTPPITSSPSPTATSSSGNSAVMTENFEGKWDDQWEWIDANDDATHDFQARPGFLRITSPDNNDLAAFTNYDAPRLMMTREGNFSIETRLEFDPSQVYQGAGLLVWQDENSFLRLEFGFGGMGGEDKHVVFLKQNEGNLELAGSIDLPETMKRIEMRIKRSANQYTAEWRPVDGTWQEIGTTESYFGPSVKVGIVQVTQYTSDEIPADFDFFKLYSK